MKYPKTTNVDKIPASVSRIIVYHHLVHSSFLHNILSIIPLDKVNILVLISWEEKQSKLSLKIKSGRNLHDAGRSTRKMHILSCNLIFFQAAIDWVNMTATRIFSKFLF